MSRHNAVRLAVVGVTEKGIAKTTITYIKKGDQGETLNERDERGANQGALRAWRGYTKMDRLCG